MRPIVSLVVLALMLNAGASAEPCNPVVDGTYCASQPPLRDAPSRTSASMNPIQNLAGDLSLGQSRDQPATLGAITFQGGRRCVGLFRTASCH